MWAVRAAEGFDGQVGGQMALEMPVASEAATTGRTSVVTHAGSSSKAQLSHARHASRTVLCLNHPVKDHNMKDHTW
ncbi:hypothetical protein Pcinc_014514 [Petrolisthes cinctipes]|uniref:Uncharacterized protein n=1 Tax=Petrolisthes cinctipes TaxID=88211 RepID=A0AAE1FXQ4_PETCI|nr:hypothetical protein Pcinc_014514 [Petrolisthes cinctipes]